MPGIFPWKGHLGYSGATFSRPGSRSLLRCHFCIYFLGSGGLQVTGALQLFQLFYFLLWTKTRTTCTSLRCQGFASLPKPQHDNRWERRGKRSKQGKNMLETKEARTFPERKAKGDQGLPLPLTIPVSSCKTVLERLVVPIK